MWGWRPQDSPTDHGTGGSRSARAAPTGSRPGPTVSGQPTPVRSCSCARSAERARAGGWRGYSPAGAARAARLGLIRIAARGPDRWSQRTTVAITATTIASTISVSTAGPIRTRSAGRLRPSRVNVVPGCGIDSQVAPCCADGRTDRARRTRPCRRGRAGSGPRSHRRPGPVHVGRPAGAVVPAQHAGALGRVGIRVPACLVLRHRRPPETQPLTVDDREAAATASTSQSTGPRRRGPIRLPIMGAAGRGRTTRRVPTAAGRDQGADLRVRSRRRRLGRQSRTRRARTLRPWGDAPTVTPTSSTYKVVSHPHVVNSMGATTNRFSPGDPQDRPQAQARRWRRCTARTAATPTPA